MARVFDIWRTGHKPFAEVGSDTFMLATPQANMLWTCDPTICHQLESPYPKFQKAVEMLKFVEVYGPNVISVEGTDWKRHRKVIQSGFNPSTNALVWKETTNETKLLLNRWSKQNNIVRVARHWTNRLALHVIAPVFFNKRLTWSDSANGLEPAPPGHALPFEQALFTILQRFGVLLMTPRALLGLLPFKTFRETHVAFTEFTGYLQELITDTKSQLIEKAFRPSRESGIRSCQLGFWSPARASVLHAPGDRVKSHGG